MSSTTNNLPSHVVTTSDIYESLNHVRQNDSLRVVNVDRRRRRTLTDDELVAAVKAYLRNIKLKAHNADILFATAVGFGRKKPVRSKSNAAVRHKDRDRAQKSKSDKQKTRSQKSDISHFTGTKDRDRQSGHEYPCICDLSLPRKSLTEEERFAKGLHNLRTSIDRKMVLGAVPVTPGKRQKPAAADDSKFTGLKDRDRLPGHQYPCVCDLSVPRKALTEVERDKQGREYLRSPINISPQRRRVAERKPKKYPIPTDSPAQLKVQRSPRVIQMEHKTMEPVVRPHRTIVNPEVMEPVVESRKGIVAAEAVDPTQPPPMMRQAALTSPLVTRGFLHEVGGRPPRRSPPRLKLTVPQMQLSRRKPHHGKERKESSESNLGGKVHMNRTAFLRMEHTKYCGRGMTISLMGGARLKDEELALLQKKKDRSNKGKNKKKNNPNGKNKNSNMSAEEESKMLEREKDDARRRRMEEALDGVECSYFNCAHIVESKRKKKRKGGKAKVR